MAAVKVSRTFATFGEYLDSLASTPRWDGAGNQSENGGLRFTATHSYADAIQLAEAGWTEGVEKIEALTAQIAGNVLLHAKRQEIAFDVAGDCGFDIGRVLTGEPECAMTWTEGEAEIIGRRIVKIGVNLTTSCAVDADAMMRRGAAIAALVECLERLGIRCDVTLVDRMQQTYSGREHPTHDVYIHVKDASEPLQMDKLAFTLVHPSMLRRLSFRYRESHALGRAESIAMTYNGGYGRSADAEPAPGTFDLWVGTQSGWEDWSACARWVREQLTAQGVQFDESEAQ